MRKLHAWRFKIADNFEKATAATGAASREDETAGHALGRLLLLAARSDTSFQDARAARLFPSRNKSLPPRRLYEYSARPRSGHLSPRDSGMAGFKGAPPATENCARLSRGRTWDRGGCTRSHRLGTCDPPDVLRRGRLPGMFTLGLVKNEWGTWGRAS